MRISVITPRYAISGVPLAQIRFARALAATGHEVDLVIGYVNHGLVVPEIEGVRVQVLNSPRVIGTVSSLMAHLKSRRPDVVFSAEDHLNAVVLIAAILSRSNAKISGSSRVTPFDTYSRVPFSKRWVLKTIMRMVMRRADVLTCVSQGMVEQYRKVFRSPPHVCVYNIVGDERSAARISEPLDDPWFKDRERPILVAAGNLAPWKGFDNLLRAVAVLRETIPARLVLLGDGPSRRELEQLAVELGLQDVVRFTGNVDNPLKYFANADAFVLSSIVEGMPNVLVEAMMCGCTPVATDCPTGPRELLRDGRYGYLVPVGDPKALADGIKKALSSPISTELLREAVQPFAATAVIARHFALLGVEPPALNE